MKLSNENQNIIDLISIVVLMCLVVGILYVNMRLVDWRARKAIHNFVSEKCYK